MAAVENIKSSSITDFDATPPLVHSAGVGAPGILHQVDGSAAVTGTTSSAGSTYQLCRVPVNAIVKSVKLWLDYASTTITIDTGVTFSTSPSDGTPSADQPATFGGAPTYANTIAVGSTGSAQALFTDGLALAAVVEPTEYSGQTNATVAGSYTSVQRQQPLWQVLGLASPPAGNFDITCTLHAGDNAGAAAVINCSVEYTIAPG